MLRPSVGCKQRVTGAGEIGQRVQERSIKIEDKGLEILR